MWFFHENEVLLARLTRISYFQYASKGGEKHKERSPYVPVYQLLFQDVYGSASSWV